MRRWVSFAVSLIVTLFGASSATAQDGWGDRRGRAGIELFSEPNFQGERRFFPGAEYNLAERGFNDRTFSVRITGRESWQLCDDANLGGRCIYLNRDEPDLSRHGLAGRVSSFRPANDLDGGPGWGGGRPDYRGPGLTLFERPGFAGRSVRLREQAADFSWPAVSFNDAAQSLVANGRWWVCEHKDFGGRCELVEGEYTDLSRIGLWGRISSARPATRDEGGGWNNGGSGNWGRPDSGPAAQGRTAGFFPNPSMGGRAVPACEYGEGRACVKDAADAFCRRAGYRDSAYATTGRGRSGAFLEDVLCVR